MKYVAEQFDFPVDFPADFLEIQPMTGIVDDKYRLNISIVRPSFNILECSVFDHPAHALVNSVNCIGVMGAGIALEFKNKFPMMFEDYKSYCKRGKLHPGDAYLFKFDSNSYIIGLAVKNDWRQWSTLEWLEASIKSLKLTILENDIKSVNLPVLGGKNGRRGPHGKVPNMTEPPEFKDIIKLLQSELEPFANKFGIQINLCIPNDKPKIKREEVSSQFFI